MSDELEEHRKALSLSEAAQQALQNEAVMAYFKSVEAQAIDALLGADLLDDEARVKLTVVAQTCRKLRTYLEEAVDGGVYAGEMIDRILKEKGEQ